MFHQAYFSEMRKQVTCCRSFGQLICGSALIHDLADDGLQITYSRSWHDVIAVKSQELRYKNQNTDQTFGGKLILEDR